MAATTTGLNLGGKLFFGGLCVGTFGLGCWQTQRFFEKETMIKQRKEDLELEPIPFSSTTGRSPDDRGLRRQLVHGVYQHDKEILVGPRGPPPGAMASTGPSSGRSGGGMSSSPQGYYIITPLETTLGTKVFVNRGWIPRHFLKNEKQQSWEKPTGYVDVVGIPSKGEQPRFIKADHELDKQPMQMFWIDQASMEHVSGIDEGTGLFLTEVRTTESDTIRWPVKPALETVGEFKTTPIIHAGYAATWFGLSGAGMIMTRKLITRGRG